MDSSWIGGHNIQIGDVTGDLAILLERPLFRLELLRPTESPELPARVRHQPSYLLSPGNQVVPYQPPISDLKRLDRWRDGSDNLSVLLLHGPGGQGKTRTAQHFAARAATDGWSVAQARDLTTAAPVLPLTQGTLGERLLIVVDYAERWRFHSLLEMLESIRIAGQNRVVRVLLLARSHTHLWDQLEAELDALGIAFAAPTALTGFPEQSRDALFSEATSAFARALDLPDLAPPAPDDLAAPSYASPLTLHMAALAAVIAASHDAERPNDISHYLLLHEQRHWNASADEDTMRALVALSTLFGPLRTRDSARGLLIATGAADGQAEANRVLKAHRVLYPTDRHLAPLRPDRFAEDFLGWYLSRDHGFAEDLAMLLVGDGIGLHDGDIRQALLVLANAARHEAVRDLLNQVISQQPDLAETSPALMVAVAEHLPLATVLTIAVRPDRGVELAYARLKVAQRLVEAIPDGESVAADIEGLRMLGSSLLACGERTEAASVLGRAVQLTREHLDAIDVASPVALADLLNLYSEALGASSGDSVLVMAEAIQVLRDHAVGLTGEDSTDCKVGLARSLSNHSKALWDSGDLPTALVSAQEADELYRELTTQNSGQFKAASVRARARIASLMHELGRLDEAVEFGRQAADALRWLSADDPDTHQIHYASTLHNLGLSLESAGRTRQAAVALAEATELYRHLAQHVPLRFLEELGGCLFALAGVLEGLEQLDELIKVRRELVGVERQLQETGLSQDSRRLAITVLLLGQNLVAVGNFEQALPALTEAIELFQTLFTPLPDGLAIGLAHAFVNLSRTHKGLGDRAAAVAAARKAVGMLRELSASSDGSDDPDDSDEAFGRLGLALEQLASCLPEGDPEHTAAQAEFNQIFGTSAPGR